MGILETITCVVLGITGEIDIRISLRDYKV